MLYKVNHSLYYRVYRRNKYLIINNQFIFPCWKNKGKGTFLGTNLFSLYLITNVY